MTTPQAAPASAEPLSKKKSGYIPTLDGWRTLAVFSVMVFHGRTYHWGFVSTRPIAHFGIFGVQLFFGISGLLICTRLLEEERVRGTLHLGGFYVRRLFRIQPPALLMLAVVSLLMLVKFIPAGWPGVFYSVVFLRNYLPAPSFVSAWPIIFTGHFWSLAVEEHFYLVLPLFLLLVKRHRARILLGLAALDIVWAIVAAYRPTGFEWENYKTDRCIYFLLFPAAIAVLLQRDRFRAWATRFLQPLVVLVLSLPVFYVSHSGNPLTVLVPAALLLSTVLHPDSWLSRFLELPPLRYLGRISFGLYLWQELFFVGRFLSPDAHPFGRLNDAPWNFLATFVLASASYYLLERPCMRLGHRLARPAIEGRPELAPSAPAQQDMARS